MSILFNVVLHVLLLGAMAAFGITLFVTAFRAPNPAERLRRFLGLFVGAMIVLGAQAGGVSFALFTASALSSGRAASAGAAAIAAIIPAIAGLGLGFYMVRVYRKSEILGLRVLCFLGMLSLIAFIEVYAVATHTNGVFLGVSAVPNISFAAGVGLVLIFGGETKSGKSLLDQATSLKDRFAGKTAQGAAQSRPDPSTTAAHDPFDI